MKSTKWIIVSLLAFGICSNQIYAQEVSLSDGLGPNFETFNPGDTIEYVASVENTGDVNLTDINIYFFAPDNPPSGPICDDPPDPADVGGVLIGTVALLEPGQMVEFTSSDNPALAFLLANAPCGGEPISLVARTGTTYFAEGSGLIRCDSEISENFADPVDTPVCTIEGPTFLCDGSTEIEYCSVDDTADSYSWSITGDGSIVGDTDGLCVLVDTTGVGSFTLTLDICNDAGEVDCCSRCQLPVTVGDCNGDTFCGFTQGFYGNKGGKACGGLKTPDLITELLSLGGPVVIGLPGNSITLDSTSCIISLLPAGGPIEILPEGNFGCPRDGLSPIPDSILKSFKKKSSRFNNVLIGQVVALTLNVRLGELPCLLNDVLDAPLGEFFIPEGPFCTVPAENPDGCPKQFESPIGGLPVAELLELANAALAGEDTGYKLDEINEAVTAINEAFDECRTVIPCPEEEICDNGCDDDFDGLIDDADPDCQFPDLIVLDLSILGFDENSIEYGFTIQNIGTGPADLDGPTAIDADNVSVQAYLSQDEIFNNAGDEAAGGTILGASPLGLLNPGETFMGSFSSGVPVDPITFNYLTLMVDWGDVVFELNEDNNTAATPIVEN